jgi:hypothetical protein
MDWCADRYNRCVASENRLPIIIFAALVALIAAPILFNEVREARRPRLVEARIVTATDADPVFRTGARRVGAVEEVSIALALEVERPGGREWWAPAAQLVIEGAPVEHRTVSRWPEKDRTLRVFWFTVESSNVGGTLDPSIAQSQLRFQSFLATEMGQDLVAEEYPEAHNDDHLGPSPGALPVSAGTIRLYARAELVNPARSEVAAVQSIATRGPDRIMDADFPAIHRSLAVFEGLHQSAGELFNLAGWEPAAGQSEQADTAADAAFGVPFEDLVDRRLVTSSRSFAAVATTGSPTIGPEPPAQPVRVSLLDGEVLRQGRGVTWAEVRPGDWLVEGHHVVVLAADDGSGLLDAADMVLHCWRRPPSVHTLGAIFPEPPTTLVLVRHGR